MCLECWEKLADFHDFYRTVEEARAIYLQSSVKEEAPNSIEILYVESIDVVATKLEFSPAQDDSIDFHDVGNIRNDVEHDSNDTHNVASSTKSLTDFSEQYDPNQTIVEASAAVTTESANELGTKTTDTSIAVELSARRNVDHLAATFMDMRCEECGHPFVSLTEAISHYKNHHKTRTARMKCCQRRLQLYSIRDHMKYHLNPDTFKYALLLQFEFEIFNFFFVTSDAQNVAKHLQQESICQPTR